MGKATGRSLDATAGSERGSGSSLRSFVGNPYPMNRFGLRFHHFGLAVPNPCAAFRFLRALGYRLGPVVFDPLQQVNLALCAHEEMPDVEVIWPSERPSPIDRILKRGGPMVYHLCRRIAGRRDWRNGGNRPQYHRTWRAEACRIVRWPTGVILQH
jgi:hypothetical protein